MGITPQELKETMVENGDALSYPYWATQEILWNGERVTVQARSRNYPNTETGD